MKFSGKTLTSAIAVIMLLVLSSAAYAMKAEYNYMSAASLNNAVQNGADIAIVDIQVADEFAAHHIKGAIKTCAYPVKSAEDKAKLADSIAKLKNTKQDIVVICPRGKGGAERTVKHLAEQGIAPYRLFILTEGQAGWPFSVEKK